MKTTFALLFIIILYSCQGGDWGEIRYTHSKTNVRALKSTSSKIVTTLQPNTKIKVVVSENDWWLVYLYYEKIKSRKTAIGYVHKSLLHLTPPIQKRVQESVKNTQKLKPTPSELKYSIIERNDVSYLNTPRMVHRIVLNVDSIPSDKSIKEFAIKLWNNGNRKWKEYSVFIYLPEMNTQSFAYAIGEFRPDKIKYFEVNPKVLTGTKWDISLKDTKSSKIISKPKRSPKPTKKWYEGGTLHNATVSQWNSSTHQNKLATAADWLAGTTWKGHLKTPNDFNKLKIQAERLVDGVDEIVYGLDLSSFNSTKVNEFAAALTTLSNDLSP